MKSHCLPVFVRHGRRRGSLLRSIAASGLVCLLASWANATPVPILQYSFDEASSGTTPAFNAGSLGSTADLTVFNGGATRTTNTPFASSVAALSVTGPGAESDATSASTVVPGTDNLPGLTVTAWINVQADPAAFARILDVGNHYGLLLNSGSASAFTLDLFNNLGADFPSTATANADHQWLFVAGSFDPASHTITYYTGNAVTAITQLGAPVADSFSNTGTGANPLLGINPLGGISVGAKPSSTLRTLDGYIDDVAAYGTPLSLSQIDAIRAANVTPAPEPASAGLLLVGLVGMWWFARRKG